MIESEGRRLLWHSNIQNKRAATYRTKGRHIQDIEFPLILIDKLIP